VFCRKFEEGPLREELKSISTILEEKREKFENLLPRLKPITLVRLKPNSGRKIRKLLSRLKPTTFA